VINQERNRIIIQRLEVNRERSWLHYSSLSLRWNELGNKRSGELSKQLFTIAALILPVSLVPLTQEKLILMTNPLAKVLLVLSWISFVSSLIFGMIHLVKEIKFFNNWSEQESDKSNLFTKPIQTSDPKRADEVVNKMHDHANELDKLPKVMPQNYLTSQIILLLLGISLIGGVLVCVLFSSTSFKQNIRHPSYIAF
jgi:hypothetical protein